MAINTVVSNDSLVVIGPPASLTVNTDIGAKGDRGSIFFSGSGLPNSLNAPDAEIGDMYINRALGGNYGTIYMYNAIPGGAAWQSIIKFQPFAYSINKTILFSSGTGSVNIPVEDFYQDIPANTTADDILVQLTAEYSFPTLMSVKNKEIKDISSIKTFVVEVSGAQFDSGTVSSLSGSVDVNLFITAGSE